MPIRVETIAEASGTLIKIDGWFRAEDIDDFVRLCEQLDRLVALDLTDLQSIDRGAIGVFLELVASGVELRAASPYVGLLLRLETENAANGPPPKPVF